VKGPSWRRLKAHPSVGDPSAANPIDPYLLWALHTSLLGTPEHTKLPYMVELEPVAMDASLQAAFRAVLQEGLPAGYETAFRTGFVSLGKLPELVKLTKQGSVRRFQLAAPRGDTLPDDESDEGVSLRGSAVARRRASGSVDTLGVIDDGCCPAHRDFHCGGRTRFLSIWDQRSTERPCSPWTRSAPLCYGEELVSSAIEAQLAAAQDERSFYEGGIRRREWMHSDHAHGSKVLHLLAGRGGQPDTVPTMSTAASVALTMTLSSTPSTKPSNTRPILFAQMPAATVADASGGSLGFYVLDGMRYIVQRTRDQAQGGDAWRTTINVSVGSIAGPHDGTTMAEQAIDELVDRFGRERVNVVMAAGNTARRDIHAHARLTREHPAAVFSVMAPPSQTEESYVEFWVDEAALDSVVFDVRPPGAASGESVRFGQAGAWADERGRVVAAVVAARKVAQGLRGSMVLLALRGTLAAGDRAHAPYGRWTVTVTSSVQTTVHAWVERNEAIIGRRAGQRTQFVRGPDIGIANATIDDSVTLSSIAHGRRVTVVGGYTRETGQRVDDGARGPVRGRKGDKPDVLAPSNESTWMPGLRVSGPMSGSVSRMGGSSAAAPYYARAAVDGAVAFVGGPAQSPPRVK
jgi:hypothetical protein